MIVLGKVICFNLVLLVLAVSVLGVLSWMDAAKQIFSGDKGHPRWRRSDVGRFVLFLKMPGVFFGCFGVFLFALFLGVFCFRVFLKMDYIHKDH